MSSRTIASSSQFCTRRTQNVFAQPRRPFIPAPTLRLDVGVRLTSGHEYAPIRAWSALGGAVAADCNRSPYHYYFSDGRRGCDRHPGQRSGVEHSGVLPQQQGQVRPLSHQRRQRPHAQPLVSIQPSPWDSATSAPFGVPQAVDPEAFSPGVPEAERPHSLHNVQRNITCTLRISCRHPYHVGRTPYRSRSRFDSPCSSASNPKNDTFLHPDGRLAP